ncbi:MAG: DUF2304 domain-containing protein [Eggerthellaceae bacterium]
MSLLFSATLLISALLIFWLILRKIRRSEVTIADSTFWFLFALSLVLMGVFRQIPFFFAGIFGIESPANFVFAYVIAVLILREFYSTVEISQLRARVRGLAQKEALRKMVVESEDEMMAKRDDSPSLGANSLEGK